MALQIPEILLYNILIGAIKHLKLDYEANTADVSQSLLHQLFDGIVLGKKDYTKDAVDLFTREKTHSRYIDVRMMFDRERANIPTVHITMPGDLEGSNSIGVGESGYTTTSENDIQTVYYERRFNSQYHIVCTSDNGDEVLLMYHTIRAIFISIFDTLSLEGLENVKLSGQELKINPDLVPKHIYMRAIGISFEYDISVPRLWTNQVIQEICTNTVTINDQ